jgi:succinyl-diaminopimelate desuccinylase
MTSSALLVHFWGGATEAHFHFFVMIVVLAVYEDWLPFLIAAAYVVVHHGVLGVLEPHGVDSHPDAVAHPWKWAAIHGAFVTAAGVASVVTWRLNEAAREEAEAAHRQARESEERFRGAFDEAPIGMVLARVGAQGAGELVEVNRAMCQLTAYRQDELVGRPLVGLWHADDVEEVAALGRLLAGDLPSCEVETRYRRGDGALGRALVHGSVVRDGTGHAGTARSRGRRAAPRSCPRCTSSSRAASIRPTPPSRPTVNRSRPPDARAGADSIPPMPAGPSDAELAERLAARTAELVDIPSESRAEAAIAAHVVGVLAGAQLTPRDAGDTCVIADAPRTSGRPLVLLAGHLDTVPAQGNLPAIREAEAVRGLGAADMQGALAVMIELARALPHSRAIDVALVFFGREELPVAESALTPLLEREPGLLEADLVVMMEPTANAIQAGCLGNINAAWTFHGRSGHSARPWQADNAIVRAAEAIAALARIPPQPHDFDGLRYVEVASVTKIHGGIAQNVIPDRAECHVNFRYVPGRTPPDAEARLAELCDAPGSELVVTSNAPSAPVASGNPLARALQRVGGLPLEPKQAWTPIAEFAAFGLDAVNFGPGDPAQAHTRGEAVTEAALVRSYQTLMTFIVTGGA